MSDDPDPPLCSLVCSVSGRVALVIEPGERVATAADFDAMMAELQRWRAAFLDGEKPAVTAEDAG